MKISTKCDCKHDEDKRKELNQLSSDIAQDAWDSLAKHLGENSILDSEDKFLCSAVAMTMVIEEMCSAIKGPDGKSIEFSQMLAYFSKIYDHKAVGTE